MTVMNKSFFLTIILLLISNFTFSQTKSVEKLEAEINRFEKPSLFSAAYLDRKDTTIVKLSLNLREENKGLKKKFREFVLELIAIYAGPGIDNKPFRNLLCINTRGKKFHFASNNTLTLLLNSGPIEFRSPDRKTEFRKRKTRENLCWDIGQELVGELATLASTKVQIGSFGVLLPANSLNYFKNYAKLVRTNAKE